MRTTAQQLLVSLIPAIAVAVLTAVLTVRMSLRRFYSERWWERKAHAYSDLIQALYVAKRWPEEWLRSEREGIRLDDAKADRLRADCLKSEDDIKQATAIGAFVISAEAVRYLEALQAELRDSRNKEHGENWLHAYVQRNVAAFDKCLTAVRECAKRDLQVS